MAGRCWRALPAALVCTAAIGFHFTTTNPFNPLQLQNLATWEPQLWNIAGYYACLLPFFFLAGVFVSLSFVLNADRIGHVYGYDLTGAGAGAALVLAAMFVVHAFFLVPLLLVPLAASACFVAGRGVGPAPPRPVLRCLAPRRCCCSTIRPSSTTSRRSTRRCTRRTRGWSRACCRRAAITSCWTISPSASTPTSPTTPACWAYRGRHRRFGLYRDGNRIAALPKPGALDVGYAGAALDALPYQLIPHARVLLAGASGGFRVAEILALGAAQIRVLEPEPVLLGRRWSRVWGRRRRGPPIRA